MRFDLLNPCSNCPFLKKGGIALTPGRVLEIAEPFLDSQGSTFACHKTVNYSDEDDDGNPNRNNPNERHCAGALMFAEKNGNATQMMRIMERIGGYDARKLMSDKKRVASVFSTLAEMLRGHKNCNGAMTGTKASRKR